MARLHRVRSETEWYHVMNRGGGRRPTFGDDVDRQAFLNVLAELCARFEVQVHAYCLMGNHYHLLLHAPAGNLSEAMHFLGTVYTQRFNRRHDSDGALFRGRFRSKPIEDDAYLMTVAAYIARNPIRLTGASFLHSYAWSSHRFYLVRGGPAWLRKDFVLAMFDNDPSMYRAFVEREENAGLDGKLDVELSIGESQSIEPSIIEAAVLTITGHKSDDLSVRPRRAPSDAQQLALVLIGHFGVPSTSDICERYGFTKPSAARSAVHRARKRLAEPEFAALVESAIAMLGRTNTSAA
jgi:REP element-mobilizing transposase RayT